MYNEDVKKKYISDNSIRNKNLDAQGRILFNRCEPYEKILKKDLACFSTTEIIECFKSFNSVSLESLMNACSQYKLYTDWCIGNKIMANDYQNHFREIDNEVLKKCLNSHLAEDRVFSRETIFQWMDNLINPRDKFILLGIFEGIGAVSKLGYEEFIDLKLNMFNTETHILELSPTHRIKYSDKLYQVAKESANTDEIVSYTNDGKVRHIKLEDSDNIVKFSFNVRSHNYKQLISNALMRYKRELNNPALTFQSLKESGRIELIKKLVKEGISLDEAISSKDVEEAYGKVPAKKRYISNYFAE